MLPEYTKITETHGILKVYYQNNRMRWSSTMCHYSHFHYFIPFNFEQPQTLFLGFLWE